MTAAFALATRLARLDFAAPSGQAGGMMKRLIVPVALLLLAACQNQPRYTIQAPPSAPIASPAKPVKPPMPTYAGTAGALAPADVGRYMDGMERDLRHYLGRIAIARPGDTLVLNLSSDVLFGKGVALSGDGRGTLRDLAATLRHYDRTLIQVNGYTDTSGSPEQNLKVSQKRAEAVAAELRAQGVDTHRIVAMGFGQTHLKRATGDGVGEPRNRRVEIRIVPHPG